MRKRNSLALGLSVAAVLTAATPLYSQAKLCKNIRGTMVETILPKEAAPNDPFGRILGMVTGDFAGYSHVSVTGFLVTPPAFSTGAPGTPSAVMQVRHGFATGPGDTITTLGKTIFNVAPGNLPGQTQAVASQCPGTPCIVQNPQVLDITGGTGRWAGATGQLRNVGLGNLNLPQGQGQFAFVVEGEVCLPASSVNALSLGKTQ